MTCKILFLLGMIFCHIVDDYYLQASGWLSSGKQKEWWIKNAPDKLYRYDYIMALFMHCFSWAFCIMIIPTYCSLTSKYVTDTNIVAAQILITFILNLIIHMITDNAKCNLKKINLIQDQLIHISQIIATWMYLVLIR